MKDGWQEAFRALGGAEPLISFFSDDKNRRLFEVVKKTDR